MGEKTLTTEQKILGGKIWEEMHRKKYSLTMIERAQTIKEYMDSTNKTPMEVAEEMNVTKKEIYRTLGLLKCPEEVKALIDEEKIGDDKVSRVIYNLKDKSEENIIKAVKEIINMKKTNTTQVEQLVSEMNDKQKIAKHYRDETRKLYISIDKVEKKLLELNAKSLRMVEIDTNHLIDALNNLITKVSNAKKELIQRNKPKKVKK